MLISRPASLIAGDTLGTFPGLPRLTLALYAESDEGSIVERLVSIRRSIVARNLQRVIINMSFGIYLSTVNDPNYEDIFHEKLQNLVNIPGRQIMVVNSAGNKGGLGYSNHKLPSKWANPQIQGHIPQMLLVGGSIHRQGNDLYGLRDPESNGGIQDMVYASYEHTCALAGAPAGSQGIKVETGTSGGKNTRP
jgi:hypothetical protein